MLYNGVPDWLYENEILKTSHTVWFSPNSLYLLYITFNDTQVGEYKYPWYDSGNPKVTYPKIKSFRFPTVSFEILDFNKNLSKFLGGNPKP